jgi:formylglycine-generating enzyme required for sulfatase activity
MLKIFISYRRKDSGYPAQQIYKVLAEYFGSGSVIFDIDKIPLGTNFLKFLDNEISACDIFLVVIGDYWIDLLKQRLGDQEDIVRIEIQTALEKKIPIVPILVGNASIPCKNDLPPKLSELTYMQAVEVRAGPDYDAHLKQMIRRLDNLLTGRRFDKETKKQRKQKHKLFLNTYTNKIGMEFVLVPAGSYMMGKGISAEEVVNRYGGDVGYFKVEHPQHHVKISHPFYIQTTQVTRYQWKEVLGRKPPPTFRYCGDDCPVDWVDWNDAQRFIKKVNSIESTDKYRLPSESEWEYVCRAGTTTEFSFGNDSRQLSNYAWFKDNAENKIHPVRTKKPNPWGLYDMHGNVSEWVEDSWHKNFKNAPADGSIWID